MLAFTYLLDFANVNGTHVCQIHASKCVSQTQARLGIEKALAGIFWYYDTCYLTPLNRSRFASPRETLVSALYGGVGIDGRVSPETWLVTHAARGPASLMPSCLADGMLCRNSTLATVINLRLGKRIDERG